MGSRNVADRIRVIVDYDRGGVPIQASIESYRDGERTHFAGLPARPFTWCDDFYYRAKELLDGEQLAMFD